MFVKHCVVGPSYKAKERLNSGEGGREEKNENKKKQIESQAKALVVGQPDTGE